MTSAEQWFAQAVADHQVGNFAGAERLYLKILDVEPAHLQTRHLLGVIRAQQGRSSEALILLESAVRDEKGDANLLANYGNVLKGLNRSAEALESFDAALALDPRHLAALYNKGQLLHQMRRYDEALAVYDRLLAFRPDYAEAWNNRGNVLRQLKRPADALDDYRKALAIKPRDAVALTNLGNAFADFAQFPDALTAYQKALAVKPDYLVATYNSGLALERLGRPQDALKVFDHVLEAEPAHPYALGHAANSALKSCDWPNVRRMARRVKEAPATQIIPPFVALGYGLDAPTLLERTRAYMRDRLPVRPEPLWGGTRYGHERIRLGYLSTDFREHAVSFQMIDVFEHHDRTRFELMGFSLGHDDGSRLRSRLVKSFDRFHDLTGMSDLDAARLIRRLEIDVAIDLSGLTQDARPEILVHRPAPAQVNYLGFAATMGADFMDYIIGDAVALPFAQQPFFTEQIVHLPGCFMAESAKKTDATLTRREAGLPKNGFVFCCFSNSWKIAEPVFDLWMRLLAEVPGSVLWLKETEETIRARFRHAAGTRGIAPERLIFTARVRRETYLAQFSLADLFLDTLPYNAHATASDALAMGLPLLTCRGDTFAGRVAASLLEATGVAELVVDNLSTYEARAKTLAVDRPHLRSFREKLAGNRRLARPETVTRALEGAFTRMRDAAERGEAARSFAL